MKKSHRHDEMSDRVCAIVGCEKHIKARLVETKGAFLCYEHHCKNEANRGHTVNTQPRKKRIIKGLMVKDYSASGSSGI